jgi:hypothetical protein
MEHDQRDAGEDKGGGGDRLERLERVEPYWWSRLGANIARAPNVGLKHDEIEQE